MNKNLVTKSNQLIQASYKLTANEQKIVLLLASMIQPEDKEFKRYIIKIKEFMDILGIKNKGTYREIDEATKGLIKKVFTIKKDKSRLQISWLSSAEYFDGEGVVSLKFDPDLKPYFLQLKEKFTSYRLQNIIQLKSSYSIRIYELLKQYEKIKERTFALDDLKEILCIEDEYKLYADFKRNVILVAQKELAEKTDICFTFEEIKESRKVARVRFIIQSNEKEQENIPDITLNQDLIKEVLSYTGLEESKVIKLFHKYDEQYIKENLEILKTDMKESKVDNPIGFFLSALEKDYRKRLTPFELEQQREKEEKRKQSEAAAEAALESDKRKAVGEVESIDITKFMPNAAKKIKST